MSTPHLLHHKQLHILLADDDEDDRELLSEAMSISIPQARLRTAGNGKELMDQLIRVPDALPDVLLLDLNMPIKGGQECLIEIRSNDALAHLPVIVYSTSGNQDQIDDMYQLGADYYIRKPGSFSALKQMAHLIGSMPWSGHQTPPREKFVLLKDLKNS